MRGRIPVAVKTRRWLPWVCLLLLFCLSLVSFNKFLGELRALEPPPDPLYNALFLKSGRSLWVVENDSGECRAVVAGGWKKLLNGDEIVRFHLKVTGQQDFTLRAEVSQYKVLKVAEINTPDIQYLFQHGKWSPEITREPVLLVDTADERKLLRLPAHLARELTQYLSRFLELGYKLKPVEIKEFIACRQAIELPTT
jgi:hypothetical protein